MGDSEYALGLSKAQIQYKIEIPVANIINLNKRRKAKMRAEKEKTAAENRIKFGRTKQEKQLEKQDNERHERHLDSHKLEKKDNEDLT